MQVSGQGQPGRNKCAHPLTQPHHSSPMIRLPYICTSGTIWRGLLTFCHSMSWHHGVNKTDMFLSSANRAHGGRRMMILVVDTTSITKGRGTGPGWRRPPQGTAGTQDEYHLTGGQHESSFNCFSDTKNRLIPFYLPSSVKIATLTLKNLFS